MSLAPIFEIYQRRTIPFPEDLLQGKDALPLRCKLHLGLTAAAMLFPRDPEDFAGYVAQEMAFLISEMEMMEIEFEEKSSIEFIELPRYLYGSRTNFLEYSRWQGFSEKTLQSYDFISFVSCSRTHKLCKQASATVTVRLLQR